MLHAAAIDPADELVTLPEAARLVGVAPMTLRVHALEGRVPAKRAGRMLLFRRADVEAYTAARGAPNP